jgi:hypothetical protein
MEDSLLVVNIVLSSFSLLFTFLTVFIKQLRKSKCCGVIEVDMKSTKSLNESSA